MVGAGGCGACGTRLGGAGHSGSWMHVHMHRGQQVHPGTFQGPCVWRGLHSHVCIIMLITPGRLPYVPARACDMERHHPRPCMRAIHMCHGAGTALAHASASPVVCLPASTNRLADAL